MPAQTRLHLHDLFRLDAQVPRDRLRFGHRQRRRARLHAAQVEEQLALRLGRRDLHQPPVAQDVLVHLGADPVQRERHEAHAALRVEAADGLHEAHVAFLDEVGLRQAVAQVIARHGDHQPQVRQHELARGVDVLGFLQRAAERRLLLLRQQREAVHGLDVVVEASQRCRGRESQRRTRHMRLVSCVGLARASGFLPAPATREVNFSTRNIGVLSGRLVPD